MKIIFFGLGSIGTRHLGLLQEHFNHEIYAYRTCSIKRPTPMNVHELNSWDLVDVHEPDVAFITNPTGFHIQTAIECALRGMHLFIEKPIDNKLDGLDELMEIVDKKKLTTYVAYNMRFHPEMEKLKSQIDPAKSEIVCWSNSELWPSRRQLDDVILELSHELDYASLLFGTIYEVKGIMDKTWAKLELNHDWTKVYVDLDMAAKDERRYLRFGGTWINLKPKPEMYLNQLRYFFDNIDNPRMMNNLFEAAELFRQIIKFREECHAV